MWKFSCKDVCSQNQLSHGYFILCPIGGEVLSDACDSMTIWRNHAYHRARTTSNPAREPQHPRLLLGCKSRSFCLRSHAWRRQWGVSGSQWQFCQKCSQHHLTLLHESEHLFHNLSTLSWPRSIHRFSAKLSACITGIKTLSRFESWRQCKLLNPSVACLRVYQDIQKAIFY